jgi:Family of unknown function (DUF6152)
MRARRWVILFSVLALAAVSVFAHHGSAVSYDLTQRVVLKGVITDFKYINPHPGIFWDVTDDKGNVTHWTGEIAPNIAQLQQAGWGKKRSERALAPGTAVTVTVSPSRAGGPVGLVQRIESASGEALLGEIGLGAGAGAAPPPAETKQ